VVAGRDIPRPAVARIQHHHAAQEPPQVDRRGKPRRTPTDHHHIHPSTHRRGPAASPAASIAAPTSPQRARLPAPAGTQATTSPIRPSPSVTRPYPYPKPSPAAAGRPLRVSKGGGMRRKADSGGHGAQRPPG